MFCNLGALARSEQPLREQLGRALDALLDAFPLLRHAAIYTAAVASDHFVAIASRSRDAMTIDPDHAEALVREALRHEDGVDVIDADVREALAVRLDLPMLPEALLVLPLRLGSEVIGALYLDGTATNAWRSADRELFNGVAGQLAWLITSQRGSAPERAIDAHDLALARRIQQRFLPQFDATGISGYRIAELAMRPHASSAATISIFSNTAMVAKAG